MTRRHRLLSALATIALVILLASCSIDPEGSPREIAARDRHDLSTNLNPVAGAATGSGRIYLLSPEVLGQSRTLRSVARDVGDTADDAMRALFEGPNTTELQAMLRSAIPPGTRLLAVGQDAGVLTINVSSDLQQLTGEALIDGVAQIVLTSSDVTGVSGVLITIDGVRQQWPAGSGELHSEPLTRYDFPGLVSSSQPAFPSVPSPVAAPSA